MTDATLLKLFEQANDIDFDLRYMAAREMCEMIEDEGVELTEANQMKIIEVFIKQLDDENKEVKGHAIRCLSKCISYISEGGLKKTMDRIFANFTKDDIDIYSTCFKTIVNLIDPSLYTLLLETSLPVTIRFIKDSSSSKNCLEESVEILTLLLTKLTSLIQSEAELVRMVDDSDLASRIYSLGNENNEGLKRKSSQGLGALSIYLSSKTLTGLSERLFKEIDTDDIKVNILKAQSLNNMIKNSKNKIDHKIPVFAPKIFAIIQEFLEEDKIDDYSEEHLSQYLVALISILESYLRNSENQILGWIKNNEKRGDLVAIFNKSLHYNPNMPSFLEEDSDDEDEDDDDEDDEDMSDDDEDEGFDDSSWKVRKAVVRALLSCLSLTTSEFSSDLLSQTLDNSVALIPFKDPYVQTNLLEFFEELYFQIRSILPEEERLNSTIQTIFSSCLKATEKTQEVKVLALVARNIQKLVSLSPSFGKANWNKLFKLCSEQVNNKKVTDTDLIGDYLDVLGQCTKTAHTADSGAAYYSGEISSMVKMAMDGVNHNNVKGFDLLASIFTSLSNFNESSLEQGDLNSSIDKIIGILEGKTEMKIKQRVIMTLGSLIRTRNMLSQVQLNTILDKISDALEIEALQFECFKALEGFGNTQTGGPNVSQSLNSLLNKLIDLYEKKGSIFQISIVKVFNGIHKDQINAIDDQKKIRFLNCLSKSINADNQYLARIVTNFLIEQMDHYIGLKEIKLCLSNCLAMLQIENLENELLNNIVNIYKAYIKQNKSDSGTIKNIYNQLQNDPNCKPEQASLLLSTIFLESDEQQNFLQEITDEITLKNSKNICLSLNILGHLGFTRNFAGEGRFIDAILKDTTSSEPIIKKSSIKALAGISLGNPGYFNSFLKQNILKDVEARLFYFYALNSIFENLGEGQVEKAYQTEVLGFLNSLIGEVQENERSAIFGAIGKLMAKNKDLINEKFTEWQAKGDKLNSLLLCVASMNIFKRNIKITDYEIALNFLLNATKQADFDVKTAAYTAIDVITHFQPEIVQHFSMEFCTSMSNSMFFNADHVTKVVMGAITYKVDKGAPVRKICFSLLQRLLDFENFSIRPFFDALISGLHDEEEDVRFLSLQIMKRISKEERRSLLINPAIQPQLVESLKKLEKLLFKKLKKILKEKARAYQCLQYYIYLIIYATKDPDMSKVPEYAGFMEKIEEERSKLEEIIKANDL